MGPPILAPKLPKFQWVAAQVPLLKRTTVSTISLSSFDFWNLGTVLTLVERKKGWPYLSNILPSPES